MYKLTDNQEFMIEDFQNAKPFSSFLPGIAGKNGIPLWAFYVNRGQAMASFGIRNKDYAITEFFPADKSYQYVPTHGFRTFIKFKDDKEAVSVIEPFSIIRDNDTVKETLTVGTNHLQIDYENKKRGIALTVEYFTLPHSPIAALVREVTLTNIGKRDLDLEIIDGLPTIFPSGIAHSPYKELGNTLKSWFDVETINDQYNFYFLRGSTEDNVNVSKILRGNFFASLSVLNEKEETIKPIFDRSLVFGNDLSLQYPLAFYEKNLNQIKLKHQVATNKVSGGFAPLTVNLEPGEHLRMVSLIGSGEDRDSITRFLKQNFTYRKIKEFKNVAKTITDNFTNAVETKTANPLFDGYVKQSYLDNGLRGGFPITFKYGNKRKIFYLYSRKHGDLERDYNFFSINPTYYSQGNGNYRDINQNRRLDVVFNPEIGDYNIKHFVNLIQLDGYNPLLIKDVQFTTNDKTVNFFRYGINEADVDKFKDFFHHPFSPGDLYRFVIEHSIQLSVPFEEFLTEILMLSDEKLNAEHGEGFWIDHWTYNLDLIESYLSIYPDKEGELFFETRYRFFDSPAYVNPKETKYVLKDGKVHQFFAVQINNEKQKRQYETNEQWVREQYGKGEIYETNLFSKLVLLAVIKTATIAPYGLGIEMEAGKPGWNDALNGLPGLFGSSTSELYELKRLILQLKSVNKLSNGSVVLPIETQELIEGLAKAIQNSKRHTEEEEITFWKELTKIRDSYRSLLRSGISGNNLEISLEAAFDLIRILENQVDYAIEKVERYKKQNLVPTYFYFDIQCKDDNQNEITKIKPHAVTPFLEGVVKKMKSTNSFEEAEKIYNSIRQSEIFDKKLEMYKTSMSMAEEPIELGRIRFFTPGWLENESVFLHMEYKYLLELLKKGLTEQFFKDIQTCLVPFMDPAIYGRSIIENSSFIASSANPDSSIHGNGFVARLSGSTVEFLHMWKIMFIGDKPFDYNPENEQLKFCLQPTLPKWLFKENGTISFTLFSKIKVTYHNISGRDAFYKDGVKPVRYHIRYENGQELVVDEHEIVGEVARDIRNKRVNHIIVDLNN